MPDMVLRTEFRALKDGRIVLILRIRLENDLRAVGEDQRRISEASLLLVGNVGVRAGLLGLEVLW